MEHIPWLDDYCAPVVSGIWSQITGRGVPFVGAHQYATGLEDLGEMAFLPPTEVEPHKAQELVGDFMALSQKSQARLDIPLRQIEPLQKAIRG